MYIPKLSTHSGRLERWLGPEQAALLSSVGKDWYGPPIPIVGVPGSVWLRGSPGGGDFVGRIKGGGFGNLYDYSRQHLRAAARRWSRRQDLTANAGFSSLGDLISEATAGGKKRIFVYKKVGVTGVVGSCNTLWYEGDQPGVGVTAGAVPGGTVHVDSDAGAFLFTNPSGSDTQHLTRWDSNATVVSNTLMLYDRLFAVEATMNDNTQKTVNGVPTRYQNTTGGAADSIAGNFLFIECRAALPATAHNWTVCTYQDQGDAASTLPSMTGNTSCIAKRFDMIGGNWFCPLEAGDTGIKALTAEQCSQVVASGNVAFVIGHPLAVLAHPVINMMWTMDGATGAFNLNRIFDDACLAFFELLKPATTATTYTGLFESVAG